MFEFNSQSIDESSVFRLLVGVFEGGIHQIKAFEKGKTPSSTLPDRDTQLFSWAASWPVCWGSVLMTMSDPNDNASTVICTLDRAAIENGLLLMAQNSPEQFNDFMDERDSVATSYIFIQYCLFGKLVYSQDRGLGQAFG